MPAVTVPKGSLAFGAGYLYFSLPGIAMPAGTVVGNVFTDTWPVGWFLWGITKEGHEMTYDITTDTVEAAEYLDPLAYVTTGRAAGIKFELMNVHATNFARALNGGIITTTGSSGAGTLRNKVTSPPLGSETRCQIGWEGNDGTERVYAEKAFQVGTISLNRKKGADVATIPVEFRFEIGTVTNEPFIYDTAGPTRA